MAKKTKAKTVKVGEEEVNELLKNLHLTARASKDDIFTIVTAIFFLHSDLLSEALSMLVERTDLFPQINEMVKASINDAIADALESAQAISDMNPPDKYVCDIPNPFIN